MIVSDTFYNVKCDSCGCMLNDMWYQESETTEAALEDCGWMKLGDRHYCEDCWQRDDDDNIVTNDGRKYDDYTHKEIKTRRMNYLELDGTMTLTQFRIELERGLALYNSMVGTLYKGMLAIDLNEGYEWFQELLAERKGTAEWEAYHAFNRHGIFDRFRNDFIDRLHNKK